MELWIRSQDKKVFENVKGFCITHSSENYWNILNVDTTTRYGTYKTEERAFEVLDEIQDKLNVLVTNEAGAEFILARNLVPIIYKMPKD